MNIIPLLYCECQYKYLKKWNLTDILAKPHKNQCINKCIMRLFCNFIQKTCKNNFLKHQNMRILDKNPSLIYIYGLMLQRKMKVSANFLQKVNNYKSFCKNMHFLSFCKPLFRGEKAPNTSFLQIKTAPLKSTWVGRRRYTASHLMRVNGLPFFWKKQHMVVFFRVLHRENHHFRCRL